MMLHKFVPDLTMLPDLLPDLPQGSFVEVNVLFSQDNGTRIIEAQRAQDGGDHRTGLGGLPEGFVVKEMKRAGACGLTTLVEAFHWGAMMRENLPHVLKAFAVCKDADNIYVLMPRATKDLLDFVNDLILLGQVLNEEGLRMLGTQILTGVQGLHRNGRVHGDLSPENFVLADRSPNALHIIDWGTTDIVHVPGDADSELLLPRTKCTGKKHCRAPETVNLDGRPLSSGKKRDCYQAGVVFFFLASRTYPFGEAELEEELRHPVSREELPTGGCAASVRKLVKWRPGASPELQDFLGRLLAPNPDRRLTATEALAHPWMAGPRA
jgi:serine/threonine protein kinase